jgi:hypothetical protein
MPIQAVTSAWETISLTSGRKKSTHGQTYALDVSAVFRKHLSGVFAGENYTDALSSDLAKVVSKGAPPKRVHVSEAIRMDINLASALAVLLQQVNELMGRAAVEMAGQLQMEATV